MDEQGEGWIPAPKRERFKVKTVRMRMGATEHMRRYGPSAAAAYGNAEKAQWNRRVDDDFYGQGRYRKGRKVRRVKKGRGTRRRYRGRGMYTNTVFVFAQLVAH